jgi:hypothetical protein
MKKEGSPPRPAYSKPSIEVLGDFAELTLGSKWQSFSDLSHGIGNAIGDGGPGS